MSRKSRAWILLPAAIAVIALVGLVLSNRQQEVGLMDLGKSMRAALAAAITAQERAGGVGARGYEEYSQALLVAVVAEKNAASDNAADTRLRQSLAEILDCLRAAREAWQAELDAAWDPATHGWPSYWNTLHPALDISSEQLLTAAEVRLMAGERAAGLLQRAADLAD